MSVAVAVPSCREAGRRAFVEAGGPEHSRQGARLNAVEDATERGFRPGGAGATGVERLCRADAPPGMLDCNGARSPGCRQIGLRRAHFP